MAPQIGLGAVTESRRVISSFSALNFLLMLWLSIFLRCLVPVATEQITLLSPFLLFDR